MGYIGIYSPNLSSFNVSNNVLSYKLQVKESTGQAIITVPKNMRKAKGWEDGQELEWKINDKGDLELEGNDTS